MNKYQILALIGLIVVITIPITINIFFFNGQTNPPTEEGSNGDGSNQGSGNGPGNQNNGNNTGSDQDNQDGKEIYWGVDSASSVNESLYQCVKENFGQPEIWGRYLGTKEDVSAGLDTNEVTFLHENNIRILVIYNHFTDATGYDHGTQEAEQAISLAKDLGIPDGVALVGDIEPSFPVDYAFMEGWHDTLSASTYEPGIYGVFDEGSAILQAYNASKQEAQENTIVWTAYPQEKITAKENAPEYNPQGPSDALLFGWQYAIEAEQCNIDTDLFKGEILDYLW